MNSNPSATNNVLRGEIMCKVYKTICKTAWAIPPTPLMLDHGNDYHTCSICGEPVEVIEFKDELPNNCAHLGCTNEPATGLNFCEEHLLTYIDEDRLYEASIEESMKDQRDLLRLSTTPLLDFEFATVIKLAAEGSMENRQAYLDRNGFTKSEYRRSPITIEVGGKEYILASDVVGAIKETRELIFDHYIPTTIADYMDKVNLIRDKLRTEILKDLGLEKEL